MNRTLKQVGEKPFHVRGPINLAALDSVYNALLPKAKNLPSGLKEKLSKLYDDEEFRQSIFFNTSDNSTVGKRLEIVSKHLK
ncbi:hypothetical protein OA90_27110 [Labrenzia sp. OB1]|nr:hypothetical protein OA90_27110 [Labrenzia sp. OB1]